MKNFYEQVVSSIYNPHFYKELEHKPASYTIVYVCKLAVTIGIIAAIVGTGFFYSFEKGVLKRSNAESVGQVLTNYVNEHFADDLVITLRNGHLSTNKEEPVTFPIPDEWIGIEKKEGELDNFVVISPNEELNDTLFDKYSAYGVLASSSAGFYEQSNGTIRTFTYSEADEEYNDIVVTKSLAMEKTQIAADYVNKFAPLALLGVFLMIFALCFFFVTIGTFVFALFTGLVALIVGRIANIKGSYGTWYMKAVHADTLYILLSWTVGMVVTLSIIPFLSTLLVMLVLVANKNFKE